MIQPSVTHIPCDLDQQRKRSEARRDAVAHAVSHRSGRRSFVERLLRFVGRGRAPGSELSADDLRRGGGEDVLHSFRF